MSCSICLEILSDPSVCITLHSNHEFHVKCLLKWINAEGKIWYENKAQCPLCRQDLIQQDFENIAKYLITIYQNKQYQNVMCIEDIDAIHSVIDLLIMKFRQIEIARDVIEKCIIEKYDRILEINDVNDNTIEIYWHVHSAIIKLEVINIINNIQKSSNFSPLQIYETNINAVKKIETHFQNIRDMCQRDTVSNEALSLVLTKFPTLLHFMQDLYTNLIKGAEINEMEEYKKEYRKKLEIAFEMEATFLLSMAEGAYDDDEYEAAVNYAQNALRISDKCEHITQIRYDCYYLLGQIEERYEEWKNAIEWYEKCYELNQNNLISNFQILTFMANCYENMGVKEEAINILKTRMVEIIEKDEQLKKEHLWYLMIAYRKLGYLYRDIEISMCVMYYEKFVQQTKHYEESVCVMNSLRGMDITRDQLCETMIDEHYKGSVHVMNSLGWILHAVLKKDFERAKDLYERALSINDECDYLCH
eukprot:311357_1